jgi:gliding motility-associated-like protein
MNAVYTPTAAEITAGSVTLTLTTIGNGNCLAVSDQVVISYAPVPTVNAGTTLVSCANNPVVTLNGSFTSSTGAQWSGGTGFFNPTNQTMNATYTPSATEIANGFVTLTLTSTGAGACTPATSSVNITINPSPVVNAGANFSMCANNLNTPLSGSVNFATGGIWSGGAGTYSPNATTLNAVYQPTAAEISAGFVVLTLTSTGNGTCNAVSSQVTITLTPAPAVDAGVNMSVCANNPMAQLNASFTVAAGVTWSGGAGLYNPSSNAVNAQYTPSASEISNGSVTLTLTSFGNGNCLPVSDQVTISITPAPVVNAGADVFACVDNLSVPMTGSVTGPTTSGVWSTAGTGSFVPNPFTLTGSYIASSVDSIIGSVNLTLTSTGNGLCTPVTDVMTVFILPAGTANAGIDRTVCANNSAVNLTGIIGGSASSGVWTTSGTGIFTPSSAITNPTYLPSPADIAAGSVTLTFSVNSCNQAADNMVVTITPAPIVNAGTDLTACSSDAGIQLSGAVSGASNTGIWTTSGSGTFVPDANTLNATYQWSPADVTAQVITLTLTATGIGNCVGVSDQLTLNVFPQGVSNAGPDQTVCANNSLVQLNASLTGATQGIWTTTGTGTFSPSPIAFNATYTPGAADIAIGSANLVFTATNSCNSAIDFMVVTITPAPVVNAGADQAVCGNIIPFAINGSVSNAGGGLWTTSGTGVFQNSGSLSTFYVASPADITSGQVQLTLTSISNGLCNAVSDVMTITMNTGIVVNAGPDRSVCTSAGSTVLSGTVTNGSTTGTWSTTGTGFFTPNANSLNAIYTFSPADVLAGSITMTLTSTNNGICSAANDSFLLTFGNTAFVDAGSDFTICQSEDLIQLNGFVSGETTTGMWSTSGTGTFFPSATDLNAFYAPSPADLVTGTTQITLVSTNSLLCNEGTDQITLTLQPLPQANAGADILVCGATDPVQVVGNITGATGSQWTTSGTGTFLPNDAALVVLYVPSQVDSIIGTATLTLTTTGNGQCASTTDQMVISFDGVVIPNAGPASVEVCETTSSVPLNGSLSGVSGFTWTTAGTGSFDPGADELTTNYMPSQEDKAAGFVMVYLATDASGSCPGGLDSLLINFDRIPTIDVASTAASCTSSPEVSLSANVAFQDAILWTGNGGGTFTPSNSVANVTYNPTPSEVLSGSSTVTISLANNGACGGSNQNVTLNFVTPAVVEAGPEIIICANEELVQLGGAVSGGTTSGEWSTAGFGTFGPTGTGIGAFYNVSPTDVLVGFVNFTLTSTNNGPCPAVTDGMQLTINRAPVVNAGPDVPVCATSGTFPLSAASTDVIGVLWSTSGDGIFLPSADVPDPEYVFGVNDAVSGFITITLTGAGNQGCADATDTKILTVTNPLAAGFSYTNACAGASALFTDATQVFNGTISAWHWDFGNGNESSQQNPQFGFDEPGSYSVTLTVTSSLGCDDVITQIVNVLPRPTASFTMSNNPAPVFFDVIFDNNSSNASSYQWIFGDGLGTSDEMNPVYAYQDPGEYVVTLIARNDEGCTDSFTRNIVIDATYVLPPRLPNSFSPNSDGNNDVFFVRGGPFTEMVFKVYDGWGRNVFTSTNQETGWDGYDDGKQSPTGVYVYTIKATTEYGDTYEFSGKINLLR